MLINRQTQNSKIWTKMWHSLNYIKLCYVAMTNLTNTARSRKQTVLQEGRKL